MPTTPSSGNNTGSERHFPASHSSLPPSPPIKRSIGKFILLIVAGTIIAAMLLLVVLNLDANNQPRDQSPAPEHVIELIPPAALTDEEISAESLARGGSVRPVNAQRGHIQTLEDGKLRQYRFEALDPNPQGMSSGWAKMDKPEIEAHLENNWVLTLQGDSALVRMPSKTPESGTMTGNVIIRLYELKPEQSFDVNAVAPAMEVKTNSATFNNLQGEITTDGTVDIQTRTAHLPGEGLRLQINEIERRPEWLSLREAGPIRLAMAADRASSAPNSSSETTTKPLKVEKNKRDKTPSTTPAVPEAVKPEAAPQFYHLSLHENVHIQQGDGLSGWTADGDALHVIFSMQSEVLEGSLSSAASIEEAPQQVVLHHGVRDLPVVPSLSNAFATLAIAVASSEVTTGLYRPTADEIVITCDGGLNMVPLVNAAEKPASTDDVRFELTGRPLKLHHAADRIDIACVTLLYQSLFQKLQLTGDGEHPLTVDSPQLRAAGERFWFHRLENQGGFAGPGSMVTQDPPHSPPTSLPDSSGSSATTLHENANEDVRIQWMQRVDLRFAKPSNSTSDGSMTALQGASFVGDVDVSSRELSMRADAMNVGFTSESTAQQTSQADHGRTIQFLDGEGSVRIVSATNEGSISSQKLHVDFAQNNEGKTLPVSMLASGEVAAVDDQNQTVWSNRLEIAFKPEHQSSSSRATLVQSLTAHENVQVLMNDGSRVFADKLVGETDSETITLTGIDVMVVSDRAIVHRGAHLQLHKPTNRAMWNGPGEFAYFQSPPIDIAQRRVDRPRVEEIDTRAHPIEVQASWKDQMEYDGTFGNGAGALVLRGAVAAVATPKPLELNTMNGQALTLQFTNAQPSTTQPNTVSSTSPSKFSQGSRALKQVIVEGDAKIESRTWLLADHSDKPRVFSVAGPHVTYDAQTLEASVEGAGELLIRDEQPAAIASSDSTAKSSAMSAQGVTSFKWQDYLHMTRRPDNLYDIAMRGGIRMIHQATPESITKLTGDRLDAIVGRRAADNASTSASASASPSAFDLGGAMSLRSLRGSGSMYIESPTRGVDCEEFEYNYATGVATLTAHPGSTVAITTKGSANIFRARSVSWNMIDDNITEMTVTEGSGMGSN